MPFDRKMEGANICWMSTFFVKYDRFLLSTSIRAGVAVQGPLVIHKLLLFYSLWIDALH